MRVAVLWKVWNDYLEAALDVLAQQPDVEVLLCETSAHDRLNEPGRRYAGVRRHQLADGEGELFAALERFQPEVLLVCSWNVKAYRRVARRWRHRAVRLVYMDNQWLGTPKQYLGIFTSPVFLWPCFDGAFATGRRQRSFAARLGFGRRRVALGAITADTRKFAGPPARIGFVFVGRMIHEKGLDILGPAYRTYRSMVDEPWPLIACGTGPSSHHLEGIEGVEMLGFVQPDELASTMRRGTCLVLTGRSEAYGVVVHEAVACGLHVIASTAVGAADDFVADGLNGKISHLDCESVAAALVWMHERTDEQHQAGIAASYGFAARQSPQIWADRLLELAGRFRSRGPLRASPR